jgi:AAHS family 3-hydroxyphenylpropionic acid transporter
MIGVGVPLGGAVASFASGVTTGDWRLIFGLAAGAALVVLPLLTLLPPNTRPASPDHRQTHPAQLTAALFGHGQLARTALLWLASFCVFLTAALLINWLPSLLIAKGLERSSASLAQMCFGLGGAIGSLPVGLAMDGHRRRLTIIVVFIAFGAAVVLLGALPGRAALIFGGAGLVGATMLGMQTMLYSIFPANYPEATRASGVGAAVSVGRIGSIAGPAFAGMLGALGFSPQLVMLSMLPFVVVGCFAVLAVVRD